MPYIKITKDDEREIAGGHYPEFRWPRKVYADPGPKVKMGAWAFIRDDLLPFLGKCLFVFLLIAFCALVAGL